MTARLHAPRGWRDVVALLASWPDADQRKIAQELIYRTKTFRILAPPIEVWRDPEDIPLGRDVLIMSVSGIVCEARASGSGASGKKCNTRWTKGPDRYGPRRTHCFRVHGNVRNGDIWAVGWQEISSVSKSEEPEK
jgi:hypothetical protein